MTSLTHMSFRAILLGFILFCVGCGKGNNDGAMRFAVEFDPGVWGTEMCPYQGKDYKVRWLQSETLGSINNDGPEQDVVVEFDLGTFGKPHTARLNVNGMDAAEAHQITRVFWMEGSELAAYRVHLRAGKNEFELRSLETPDALPGARQVCFMLIGDVRFKKSS